MEKELIKAISSIKSSKYRRDILKALGSEILTPSEIAKMTKFRLNHVSAFLKELKNQGLIKCLNEEDKRGRLYQITGLGRKVIDVLKL